MDVARRLWPWCLVLVFMGLLGLAPAWADFNAGVQATQRGDYVTALREFRPLALQGNATAQYNLGVMYYHGQGEAQDYTQAVAWYRKAAEQGHISAQFNLGLMYYHGQGEAQDYTQAVAWYRKAAEQGHAKAQYALGYIYINGQGVPQEDAQAIRWFQRAAEQGDTEAQTALKMLYSQDRDWSQVFRMSSLVVWLISTVGFWYIVQLAIIFLEATIPNYYVRLAVMTFTGVAIGAAASAVGYFFVIIASLLFIQLRRLKSKIRAATGVNSAIALKYIIPAYLLVLFAMIGSQVFSLGTCDFDVHSGALVCRRYFFERLYTPPHLRVYKSLGSP